MADVNQCGGFDPGFRIAGDGGLPPLIQDAENAIGDAVSVLRDRLNQCIAQSGGDYERAVQCVRAFIGDDLEDAEQALQQGFDIIRLSLQRIISTVTEQLFILGGAAGGGQGGGVLPGPVPIPGPAGGPPIPPIPPPPGDALGVGGIGGGEGDGIPPPPVVNIGGLQCPAPVVNCQPPNVIVNPVVGPITVNVSPPVVHVQFKEGDLTVAPEITIEPQQITVEPAPVTVVTQPNGKPVVTSGGGGAGADIDFPIDLESPLAMKFSGDDSDWLAAAKAWAGPGLSDFIDSESYDEFTADVWNDIPTINVPEPVD